MFLIKRKYDGKYFINRLVSYVARMRVKDEENGIDKLHWSSDLNLCIPFGSARAARQKLTPNLPNDACDCGGMKDWRRRCKKKCLRRVMARECFDTRYEIIEIEYRLKGEMDVNRVREVP